MRHIGDPLGVAERLAAVPEAFPCRTACSVDAVVRCNTRACIVHRRRLELPSFEANVIPSMFPPQTLRFPAADPTLSGFIQFSLHADCDVAEIGVEADARIGSTTGVILEMVSKLLLQKGSSRKKWPRREG